MKVIIVGGAGFIGSHFLDYFLTKYAENTVRVFDDLSSGVRHHARYQNDPRMIPIMGDVKNLDHIAKAMEGCDLVIHLASNPDISKSATDPLIDFYRGTLLTQNVVEAMRLAGVERLIYASGSGVYGDYGSQLIDEDFPLCPESTYGASKLAGEAIIQAYASMFGIRANVFRFANVIGPRQTHGVILDFVRKLRRNPHDLVILGDGKQQKSYIHVYDIVSAVMAVQQRSGWQFEAFNVSTNETITVAEIAAIVAEEMKIMNPSFRFSGGDRGWVGDIPVVRLNSSKIRRTTGWIPAYTTHQAVRMATADLLAENP